MKKTSSKFLALLLILSTLFSFSGIGIQAVGPTVETTSFVSLGDSIATGYGLANYDATNLTKASESYINQLGVAMMETPLNLAKDGLTTSGLLTLLADKNVQAQLANARVITVSIGGNNILKPMIDAIKTEFALKTTESNATLATAFSAIGLTKGTVVVQSALTKAQPEIDLGVTAFQTEFPQIMTEIHKLNPQARVLVSTIYNAYGGVKFGTLDFDTPTQKSISAMNDTIKETLNKAEFAGTYEIMDVASALGKVPMNYKYVNVSFTPINLDPHPSAAGHKVIFNLYAKALISNFVSVDFTDISSSRAQNSIRYLAGIGIIGGIGNGLFAPDAYVTRAQFVKILSGTVKDQNLKLNAPKSFVDIVSNKWYSTYINWAVESGVTVGNTKNEFSPNANITRQDLVVMVYRYIQKSGYALPEVSKTELFADDTSIAPYAKEAIYYIKALGFLTEKTGENFRPTVNATRGEVTEILAKYAKLIRN